MIKRLKVLVAGCGSIGRRHVRNLRSLGVADFVLCDPNTEALKRASEGLANPVLHTDFDASLGEGVDAAVICSPSALHVPMSRKLAERGAHLFIEKPLSHTMEGAEELAALVRQKGLTAMMGMCYRFHPVTRHLKRLLEADTLGKVYHVNYYGGHYLPDWHPEADYRIEYAANEHMGGGVVLTSIHGLDTVRWLFGEVAEVSAFVDKVSRLEMDVEDLALAIMRTETNVFLNWQTDFLQRASQHRMVIVGEKGTIRCDFLEGLVEIFLAEYGKWYSERIPFDVNTMYVDEMKHFIECIEGGHPSSLNVEDGIRTLKLALELKAGGAAKENGERLCTTG